MTRNEETKLVKNALKNAGFNSRVKHGTGTAWGWLDIKILNTENQKWRDTILRIVQEVTGRRGDYDGCITVHIG